MAWQQVGDASESQVDNRQMFYETSLERLQPNGLAVVGNEKDRQALSQTQRGADWDWRGTIECQAKTIWGREGFIEEAARRV